MCSHAEVQQSLYRQKVREQAVSPELPDISEDAELLAASGQVFGSTRIKRYSHSQPVISSVPCQSGLIHFCSLATTQCQRPNLLKRPSPAAALNCMHNRVWESAPISIPGVQGCLFSANRPRSSGKSWRCRACSSWRAVKAGRSCQGLEGQAEGEARCGNGKAAKRGSSARERPRRGPEMGAET